MQLTIEEAIEWIHSRYPLVQDLVWIGLMRY